MSGKQSSLKDISCSVILSILNLQILILDIHKGQALFTTSNIVSSGVVSALTAALTPTCTFRCTYCCSKGSKWLQVSSTRPWNYLNFVHYAAYNTHTDTSSCPQPQLSAHTTLSPLFLLSWTRCFYVYACGRLTGIVLYSFICGWLYMWVCSHTVGLWECVWECLSASDFLQPWNPCLAFIFWGIQCFTHHPLSARALYLFSISMICVCVDSNILMHLQCYQKQTKAIVQVYMCSVNE